MSLKNYNRKIYVCLICAALFLSFSITGIQFDGPGLYSATLNMKETEAAGSTMMGIAPNSFSTEYEAEETSVSSFFEEESQEKELYENGVTYSFYEEENSDTLSETDTSQLPLNPRRNSGILRLIYTLGLIIGIILAIAFLVFDKTVKKAFFPEIDFLAIAFLVGELFSPILSQGTIWNSFTVFLNNRWYMELILRFLLFLIALLSLQNLNEWRKEAFPVTWSAVYHLIVKRIGSQEQAAAFWGIGLWCLISFDAGIVLLLFGHTNLFFILIAVVLLLCTWISARCFSWLLQEIAHQREEAIQQAVISERFKVELISNVSHDLRTPLTSIIGYGELLQKELMSPEGKEQLNRLNQKASYMKELIDELFELTKVSSGVIECSKNQIDLIKLMEQTLGLFEDQLLANHLQVRRHYCSESLPITTDGSMMHRVFANLVGNAIKYTVPGTRIHLEVTEQETYYIIRMINVASYEMDFKPEEIVQRFARGDKARTTQGSGLGLAIAQTYTEAVDGKFSVAIDGEQFIAIVELPKTDLANFS